MVVPVQVDHSVNVELVEGVAVRVAEPPELTLPPPVTVPEPVPTVEPVTE